MFVGRVGRTVVVGLIIAVALVTRPEPVGATCTTGIITGIHAGNLEAVSPSTSGTGRYTAFHTQFGLVPGDTNNQYDVYVVDRLTCALEVISVPSTGGQTSNPSSFGSVSDDGNLVAFESTDVGLTVEAPGSIGPAIYLRNRSAGTTTRISRFSGNNNFAGGSRPKISGNGSVVAFVGDNLVPQDTNGQTDIYVRDLNAGTTSRASVGTGNVQGTGGGVGNHRPGVSDDGRYISFTSTAANLVANDTNGVADTFRHDRQTGTTIRVSVGSAGQEFTQIPTYIDGDLSGDGRFAVFGRNGTELGGACSATNIWVRDVELGTTTLANPSTTSQCNAIWPTISDNGRYVAFAGSDGFVPGDTNCCLDVFVRDMTLQVTRRASTTVDGIQGDLGSPGDSAARPSISGDGQVVAFDTNAHNLVPNDTNFQEDIVIVEWKYLSIPPNVNFITNGNFAAGTNKWDTFAFPSGNDGVFTVTAGEMQFTRVPPPPGPGNQAVVLQQMHAQLQAGSAITATFQLGNSSSQRRRISALIHDSDFSDLFVCTFWVPPNTGLRTYTMRTHTTKPWFGGTIAFYAASADNDAGSNRLDNVTFQYTPAQPDDETKCIDPSAPVAVAGPPGPNLLQNGDFSGGASNWSTFGLATSQVTGGVFEIIRHGADPAGGVLQNTNQPVAQARILTAQFDLGNSSVARKRVTVLIHEGDFSDLSACTFWLPASTPRGPYVMRSYTTKAWQNATLSIYIATVGAQQWVEIDNVSLAETQATATSGIDCLEPGSSGPGSSGGSAPVGGELGAAVSGVAPAVSGQVSSSATSRATSRSRIPTAQDPMTMTGDGPLSLWLAPDADGYEIQTSADRDVWQTIAVVPPSEEWQRVIVDSLDVEGRRLFVRVRGR